MPSSVIAKCRHCGKELDPSHTGPCPSCGKTGKEVIVTVNETVGLEASVSEERTTAYFNWFNKKIDVYSTVGPVVVLIVVLLTTFVGRYLGGNFVALLGALISFVGGNVLEILTIALINRHAKKIAAISAGIEMKPEEAALWNTAVRSASKFRAFRFALNGSAFMIVFLPFVVWYYTAQHFWELKEGLDYAAIIFIAWAGLVHLSDRFFINKSTAIASCTNNSNEVNIHRLIELIAKRRLGLLSASFLAVGLICEIARFILEKTQS